MVVVERVTNIFEIIQHRQDGESLSEVEVALLHNSRIKLIRNVALPSNIFLRVPPGIGRKMIGEKHYVRDQPDVAVFAFQESREAEHSPTS